MIFDSFLYHFFKILNTHNFLVNNRQCLKSRPESPRLLTPFSYKEDSVIEVSSSEVRQESRFGQVFEKWPQLVLVDWQNIPML